MSSSSSPDLPMLSLTTVTASLHLPLPEHIVRLARADLDREIILVLNDLGRPTDTNLTPLTWRDLLSHVRRRADHILTLTRRSPRKLGDDPTNVGLLAKSDYSYFVTLLAMIMLRWTVLAISPRNSPEAVKHLMHSVKGSYLIMDAEVPTAGVEDDDYEVVQIPNEDLTESVLVSPYDELSSWDDIVGHDSDLELMKEASRPAVYLHTSGSTGHPKTISWTHDFITTMSRVMRKDRPQTAHTTLYTPLPLFHATGFTFSFVTLLNVGGIYTFINTRQPISASFPLRHLPVLQSRSTDIDVILAASLFEDIVDGDLRYYGIDILRKTSLVMFGGASLRHDVGNLLIASGVPLMAAYGMTETSLLASLSTAGKRDPMDWSYYRFLDEYRVKLEPVDDDGILHSLVVMPGEVTPCVLNQDNPVGFRTGDLWIQHPEPTKSHLWKHAGRIDDVTVLSNGEKTDNKQLDILLCKSPAIAHSVIFGSGRFLNGAILEPSVPLITYTQETVAKYLDTVWPHVANHVNPTIPQHSRLVRSLVLVAKPDKAILLTDKGTVKTRLSLAMYEQEIENAYSAMENGEGWAVDVPKSGFIADDVDAIRKFLLAAVADILQRTIGDDDDLFDAGLDSLLATRVRSAVVAALRKSDCSATIPRNVVYSFPTVNSLAQYLRSCLASDAKSDHAEDVHLQITQTIAEYTGDFPYHEAQSTSSTTPDTGAVYAVTGTTGSLGSFYVSLLLQKRSVRKLYLLNRRSRTATVEQRQKASFLEKSLDYSVVEKAAELGRAVYLEIDLGRKDLGLDQDSYEQMRDEVTHIVHIAWLLNFNLILPSFKNHLAGVRNIIDLALASPHSSPPHVTFVSSVAAAGRYPGLNPVPEAPVPSSIMCLDQGYAHSKYVAEKVLEEAVKQRPGFRATIVRSGQISGAEDTGAWARSEHMPILMRSCLELGVVPEDLPPIRWLPVNVAAQILDAEVSAGSINTNNSSAIQFYSVDNGLTAPWSLVTRVLSTFRTSESRKLVTMEEWLEKVKENPRTPAAKLLEFFEGWCRGELIQGLDVTHARRAAGNIVDYEISEDLVGRYIDYSTA